MRPTRRSQQGSHYDLMVPLLWIHEMPGLGARHYSPRTAEAYRVWVKRFVYLHRLRHPTQMGGPEINTFLTHPAVADKVSASTQNQALSALLFLYRHPPPPDWGQVADRLSPVRLGCLLEEPGGHDVRSPIDGWSGLPLLSGYRLD